MKNLLLPFTASIFLFLSSCNNGTCDDGVENQDEVGVDCGGPCASCPISYDQNSTYGQNILYGMDTLNLVTGNYSFQATVPEGSSIKVELELITGTEWFYSMNPQNWTVSDYINESQSFQNTNSGESILDFSLSPSPDPMVPVGGSFYIHYYENGTYIGSKIIYWS